MKLLDYLLELDGDQKIKVGAADGSAYWYAGTADHFLNNHKSIDERVLQNATALTEQAKENFENTAQTAPTLKRYALTAEDLTLEGYHKHVSEWLRRVSVKRETYRTRKARQEAYVPVLNREVREHEKCIPIQLNLKADCLICSFARSALKMLRNDLRSIHCV